MRCLIIAEIGVNHNGSLDIAKKSIKAAFDAGADIVKFQSFKAVNLATEQASKAVYQMENTLESESQLAMLRELELTQDEHFILSKYCDELGIEFLSSAFDSESLEFLIKKLGIKRLKIASGELTNLPFILEHAKSGLDVIVSTGMATIAEIEQALEVLAFGYISSDEVLPSLDAFAAAYTCSAGQKALREKVTILHCTTEYPAPIEHINLNAMDTIAQSFKLSVGYSDHSLGTTIPIAAVTKGAQVLEKHFTLDKTMDGPDHKASLEPNEFKAMSRAIRDVELAMGNGIKCPRFPEIKNKPVARKSLVAATDIVKGGMFDGNNIAIKRPGTGIEPSNYWSYIGQKAKKSYKAGDLIDE
ncbi:MAG: N-acetylneuraminate synthase [Aliiglaciecola sp.]